MLSRHSHPISPKCLAKDHDKCTRLYYDDSGCFGSAQACACTCGHKGEQQRQEDRERLISDALATNQIEREINPHEACGCIDGSRCTLSEEVTQLRAEAERWRLESASHENVKETLQIRLARINQEANDQAQLLTAQAYTIKALREEVARLTSDNANLSGQVSAAQAVIERTWH